MAPPTPPARDTSLKQLVRSFQDAWQGESRPTLDAYLPDATPERRAALRQLIPVDLAGRLRSGEAARIEEYLERYPELLNDSQIVPGLIVAEFELRRQQDANLPPDEYLRRFPQYQKDLSPLLQAVAVRTAPTMDVATPSESTAPTLAGRATIGAEDFPAGALPEVPGYVLLERIARGGMGVVYKARQRGLDRLVALKMILAGAHAGPEQLERFRHEAEVIGRLQHPNIVQIYEVGEQEGRPYFSLEFVDGGSLAAKLDGTPLPAQPAARLAEVLARAMHAAHQRGVVHRDLKPANILLQTTEHTEHTEKRQKDTAEDKEAQRAGVTGSSLPFSVSSVCSVVSCIPKITDFGLAKCLGGEQGQTQSGAILGTPSYMAPEQASGHPREIGPATDVYALGAILYELLTGRPPFNAANMAETLQQVVADEPVSPRRLQPRVPRDLETICLKCLQKEPRKRYPGADQLAEDLRRFQAGEPIQARPVGRLERLGRWCRRYPLDAALAGAAALFFLVTLAAISIGYWNVSQARRDALVQRDRAVEQEQTALELRDQEAAARHEADREHQQARESLRQSLFSQAQAHRQSTLGGRRSLALKALHDAAAVRPGPELRDEYLRCLDLPDLRPVPWPVADLDRNRPGPSARFLGGPDRLLILHNGQPAVADARTGQTLRVLADLGPLAGVLALSPAGKLLAARPARSAGLALYDLESGQRLGEPKEATGEPLVPVTVALSDSARLLAAVTGPQVEGRFELSVYDARSSKRIGHWTVEAQDVDCVCFSRAAKVVAASLLANDAHVVQLWGVPDGKPLATLTLESQYTHWLHVDKPRRLDVSPDGSMLVGASSTGAIKAWDLTSLRPSPGGPSDKPSAPAELFSLSAHLGEAWCAQFSPDGRWLATSGEDARINLWDVRSRALVTQVRSGGGLGGVEWSPSGALLLSEHAAGPRLWEFVPPLPRLFRSRTPTDARWGVTTLRFSPADRWLACGRDCLGATVAVIDLDQANPRDAYLGARNRPSALAFTADGDRLWKTTLFEQETWQLPSSEPAQFEPIDDTRRYEAAAFTPRGEPIAAGVQKSAALQVLDPATGQQLWQHTEWGTLYSVPPLAFGPDGKRLLAEVMPPGQVRIQARDSETGKLLFERPEGAARLFFRDGRPMSLLHTSTLAVKDLESGRLSDPVRPAGRFETNQYLISGDGTVCVETRMSGQIDVWDLTGKGLRTTIKRLGRPTARRAAAPADVRTSYTVHFTPVADRGPRPDRSYDRELQALNYDGSRLAARDGDYLGLWDTRSGKELGRVRCDPMLFFFAEPRATGEKLMAIDIRGRVFTWQPGASQLTPLCTLQVSAPGAFDLSRFRVSADRRRLAYLSSRVDAPRVYLWELPTGAQLASPRVPHLPREYFAAALNADGSRLAILEQFDTPKVWNLQTKKELLALKRIDYYLRHANLDLTHDGAYFAILDNEGEGTSLRVFDLAAGSQLFATSLAGPVACLALAKDASLVAVGVGNDILVYAPRTGQQTARLSGHELPVSCLAFDGAGQVLASVSAGDGTVRLWDAAAGERLATLATGQKQATQVALSPTGRWLAAGDTEGQVRLWDLGACRARLREAGLDWPAPPLPEPAGPPPESFLAHLEAARHHHLVGELAEAVAAYDRAVALDGSRADVYRDRGAAQLQRGSYAAAIADFEKARALDANMPLDDQIARAFESRAEAYARQEKWRQAADDYEHVYDLGRANTRVWVRLAAARVACGDLGGYRRFCARVVEKYGHTRDSETANSVGWVCTFAPDAVPDLGPVVRLVEQAVADEPDNSSLLNTLGTVLYRANRPADAVERLNQSIRAHGKGGSAWDLLILAMAHQRLGHAEEARQVLDKALPRLDAVLQGKRTDMDFAAIRSWEDRLELEFFRRDAEAAVRGQGDGPKK